MSTIAPRTWSHKHNIWYFQDFFSRRCALLCTHSTFQLEPTKLDMEGVPLVL
jgi:hypothetical protein